MIPRLGLVYVLFHILVSPGHTEPRHGIAMLGDPALEAEFTSFPYADPQAPKGGRIVFGAQGTYENLNPFIVKGLNSVASGVRQYTFESLMARSWDEPFTLYGLIAGSIDVPDDRSSATFHLRPEARFADGETITADDIVFSWDLLKTRGRPNHRYYYNKVERVEVIAPGVVRFTFKPEETGVLDREMPLIIGLMPILSAKLIDPEKFEETTLTPLTGSGPYEIANVDPGRSISYRRRYNYWGWDVPAIRGRFNFDEIRVDYYRDANSLFEAFKAGLVDVRRETDPGRWARDYNFPALTDGRIKRAAISHGRPSGLRGLVFNSRRAQFTDRRVRKAISLLFDADWVNRNLFAGGYVRTRSLFDNTELGALRAAEPQERALLAPYGAEVDPDILENGFAVSPPGARNAKRTNTRQALRLLKDAGWTVQAGHLKNGTGGGFTFEILLADAKDEKIGLIFSDALKRVGIQADVRTVDSSQFQKRRQTFDFDMFINRWGVSLSPGNEQNFYWSSSAADTEGSRNYPGVKSPAIDALIPKIVAARSREDFRAAVRAMDRVLLSGAYVIPFFHQTSDNVAWAARLAMPERNSLYGYMTDAWWDTEE